MAQEVAPQGLINRDEYIRRMAEASGRMAAGGNQYLKFSKGEYLLGKDGDTFENNTFMGLARIAKAVQGYQCWKGGKLVDEMWKPMTEELPDKTTLPDHGPYQPDKDGWQQSIKMDVVVLPSQPGGKTIAATFAISSQGARRAMGDLLTQFVDGLKEGHTPDETPLVQFTRDNYKHDSFGKIWFPKMTIKKWLSADEVREIVALGAATKALAPSPEGIKQGAAPAAPAPAKAAVDVPWTEAQAEQVSPAAARAASVAQVDAALDSI